MGNCVEKLGNEKLKDNKYLSNQKENIDNTDYKFSNENPNQTQSYPSTPHMTKPPISSSSSVPIEKKYSISSFANSNLSKLTNSQDGSHMSVKISESCTGFTNNSGENILPRLSDCTDRNWNIRSDSPSRHSQTSSLFTTSTNYESKTDIHRNRFLIAIFDYKARTIDEINLKKGDRVVLLESKYYNDINDFEQNLILSDPDWWIVEQRSTGNKGYVPSSFLAVEYSFESQEWYFPFISRKDAERLLIQPGNPRGCFLIRASETSPGAQCLSVLDYLDNSGYIVNHYKIKKTNQGHAYITTKKIFPSLAQLILFYSNGPSGLCCALSHPCSKPKPVISDLSYKTKDKWEIDRSSLQLSDLLGAGQFGEVWKGLWNGTTPVAIKTLKPGSMSKEDFLKEAKLMKSLCHVNLVRLYAICSDEPIYIVTELMSKGSLLNYLRSEIGQAMIFKQLADFISQIANGMAYLEASGYVHRDLAARNILVGDGEICKIADFGLARLMDVGCEMYEASQGSRFPVKWTAPEAALWGKFSTKSDVWSFGVLVYEIITRGQVPFPSMNNTETLKSVENGYRMPSPKQCPSCVYEIMLECWSARPERRPTFASLRSIFDDIFFNAESGYRAAECISR